MKLILTGASGFLGQHTYNNLLNGRNDIVSIDNRSIGIGKEVTIDLTKTGSYKLANICRGADAIIHLASVADFSESIKKEIFEVNTLSSIRLARLAKELNAHFVFISTISIHKRSAELIKAGLEDTPDLPYSISKWLAEEIIIEIYDKVSILRVCGIFGLNGPSHLGINKAISLTLKEKKPPEVFGTGLGKRNYIYVKDVAKIISFIVNKYKLGKMYIAGKEILSIKKMAKQICEVLIPEYSPTFLPGKDTDDQIVEPSEGLPEPISFKEALKDIKYSYEKISSFK